MFKLASHPNFKSLKVQAGLAQTPKQQGRSHQLRSIIERIWSSLEFRTIIQTTVDELAELMDLDECTFLWCPPETQRFHVVYEKTRQRSTKNSKPKTQNLEDNPGTPLTPKQTTGRQARSHQENSSWDIQPEAISNQLESGTEKHHTESLGLTGIASSKSYKLENFGSIGTAIAQGETVINCGTPVNSAGFSAVTRILSRVQHSHPQTNLSILGAIANLLVPVKGQEGWTGMLACLSHQPRAWSRDDVTLVQLVAQQLEIAIRQARLHEQSQRLAQRERLINHIANQTRQSFDLESILGQALMQLRETLEVDRCIIYLVADDQGSRGKASDFFWEEDQSRSRKTTTFRRHQHLLEASHELCPSCIDAFDPQGPLTQWIIQCRQPIMIADITQDRRVDPNSAEYQASQVKSVLAIPVQADDQLQAILYLNQCSHVRQWSKPEQELTKAVADQLAIAIQQSRLYVQTRRQMEREALLRLISDNIHNTLNLDEILQTVVQKVRQLINSDRVLIYKFTDAQQGVVLMEELLGRCSSVLERLHQNDTYLQRYAELHGVDRIHRIDDVTQEKLPEDYLAFLEWLEVQACITVPITIGSRLWGLLIVQESEAPRTWKTSDVYLLQQLAARMAIAVHQAELYEQVQVTAARAQLKAEELEQTLRQLQQTQAQLIQSEKMSSLGQLVAGVAHEINNPVNFIYGNLKYADEYIQMLMDLISLYQEHYPHPDPEIQDRMEEIDLNFLAEDLSKLLSSMKVGADRIRQIVLSLRNFSRLDQAEVKPVDIHEGLDSTLLILQNRLKEQSGKPAITIDKHYGDLPPVECYPGQLNQVFMNILANAIDALQGFEDEEGRPITSDALPANPTIVIQTEVLENSHILIRIRDNGPGMPEEVRRRLFDPFFTTKPVGKGTGLGLSISYQIVTEKHHGILNCVSEPGQGAEFQIEIPVQQSPIVETKDPAFPKA